MRRLAKLLHSLLLQPCEPAGASMFGTALPVPADPTDLAATWKCAGRVVHKVFSTHALRLSTLRMGASFLRSAGLACFLLRDPLRIEIAK